jgi:hypothetical protein
MKNGYTLVETVIVIALSVVALTALVNLFLIFNTIYGYQRAFIATAGSSGAALNALQIAVLPAEAVLASHAFTEAAYASATSTLVLKLPSVDGAGNIVSGASDYIVFYASSTALYRLVEADAASARSSGTTKLSGTLSSLTFTYDAANPSDASEVSADIVTQTLFKDQLVRSHLKEAWRLRNHLSL